MGTELVNAVDLMAEIIAQHQGDEKWTGKTLGGIRQLANTNRGQIGEDFVMQYLAAHGIDSEEAGNRAADTDILINDVRLEVKTASEDISGQFQFNHVRLDRDYLFLLCLGIFPDQVRFNGWRKGEVAEGKAGTLVPMAADQRVTFKLTKRAAQLRPIEELPAWVRENILTDE